MTMGKHLKLLRVTEGWTQQEAADKIGIMQVMVSDYETNKKKPGLKTLKAMCIVYGVTLNDFFEFI